MLPILCYTFKMKRESIEIVVIEDEEDILELIEYHLQKSGYNTMGFISTRNVEQFLAEERPALMIVDRNLPDVEGSEFIAKLRRNGCNIPVIFLTAKDEESDLEEGFERGGDDYMTKPFRPKELILRVEALLRRAGVISNDKIKYRDLSLNLTNRTLTINGYPIELTNLEFKLLFTFVKNPNTVLNRDFLRDEVWEESSLNFNDKTINVTMNRLKKKIDHQGKKEYFLPIWGVGYKLI